MYRFKSICQNNKKSILISILILFISFLLYVQSSNDTNLSEGFKLKKDGYQGRTKLVNLDISVGEMEFQNVEIEIDPIRYSEEELSKLFIASHDLIKDRLSIDTGQGYVSKDISFDSSLPDSPLEYEWIPKDISIVDETGKILTPLEVITEVTVVASYGDWSDSCVFEYRICPDEAIKERYVKEQIKELIESSKEEGKYEENLLLPQSIDGLAIQYREKESRRNIKIIIVGIVLATLTFVAAAYDKKSEINKKRNEMLLEYPVIIQKLVMYISAGMTVRNAWSRMCKSSANSKKKNCIYSEMQIIDNEMNTGISEALAYEHFGEKINDNSVIRFTTLLSQNIQKGSVSLSALLKEESLRAFEDRKNRVRKKGEEAGTKLLLPMIILLLIVTVIILVPAFWNL